MIKSSLHTARLAVSTLKAAGFFNLKTHAAVEYEPLYDADDEPVTDINSEVVTVKSA